MKNEKWEYLECTEQAYGCIFWIFSKNSKMRHSNQNRSVASWWDAFNILMSHSTIDWYCNLTSIVAPSAAVTLQAFYLWLYHWLFLAVKFALLRISTSLYKITMTTNPLLDDIRYKEGLVCMNKGMFEGAIDLFCSLAEEWWVDAISAQSIDNGIYWFYCACCSKWQWCA